MFKIYIQNKPLFLIEKISSEIQSDLHRPGAVFFEKLTIANIREALRQMESTSVNVVVFQHFNAVELLEGFKREFNLIQGAGGLVYTPSHQLLLIFRRGKWDLPKGKLDEGEDLKTCALRELEEETGLNQVKIIQPLLTTYHTYYEGQKNILKESHWFLMQSQNTPQLVPQIEEDIEICEWVPFENLSSYKVNMHSSIIDVVNEGIKKINATT